MHQQSDHNTARKNPVAQRLLFIDIARIYGVALVFYGHFIESYMKAGSDVAAVHYKFIYSFHMPLFFILAGYIAQDIRHKTHFGEYIKKHATTRLIPYAFFSLILILPTFWFTGFSVGLELPSLEGYIKGIGATVFAGFPYFNVPVWFLICLFVVEFMHYWTARYLTSPARILLISVGFYLIGSTLAWNASFLRPMNMLAQTGKIYPYFMILEAFTGYSLYLFGLFLRRRDFLIGDLDIRKGLLGITGCALVVLLTFDLNKAMFTLPFYDAVIMLASSHGNLILFPLTAITGSIMVLLLAKLSEKAQPLAFIGANTVVIFCLNGVFYHFVNDRLAQWLLQQGGGAALAIFVNGVVVSVISLIVTLPFIFLFNRFAPYLVGKRRQVMPMVPTPVS